MKISLCLFFTLVFFVSSSFSETAPVAVRLPDEKAWVGQRLPFFVELRAPGSFQGSASFDLPKLPGTIIIKIGSPVVSSEEIDGQSWFVQEHEFALFSQKTGALEVPEFPVRFASRSGFTGPASDVNEKFPGMKVDIQRPPGTENVGFLVTTESLEVTETWTPAPGAVTAGAIFKRKIIQRAAELSGMALAPAPTTAPGGVRVFSEDAVIKDTTERGAFKGERDETIIYQVTSSGSVTLPELSFIWWNPKTEKMQKSSLPAVSFDVGEAPSSASTLHQSKVSFVWLILLLLIIILVVWQKNTILRWGRQRWQDLNPADKVHAKKLLQACRQNNADGTGEAWLSWRNTQDVSFQPGPELQSAIITLQRHIFGPVPGGAWSGDELALAFTAYLKSCKKNRSSSKISVLPRLNG